MAPDPATERQNAASEPLASTWLSANAGSGKTKVLTDRVARLLLAGVAPQNILCLTYTKAAASEMQNRLFRLLGAWAMMDEAALREKLAALGERPGADLGPTRSLFARAIETPGGLKIQTIHSFCAALLRRFPLEAGVSPQFREMDERAALILREEVVEAMAMGPERAALDGLAAHFTGQDFGKLLEEIGKHRAAFAGPPDAAAIWRRLGLAPGMDEADIAAGALAPGDVARVQELFPILAAGSANERKIAARLAGFSPDLTPADKLRLLQGAFLTQTDKQPLKKPLTKGTAEGPAAHLVEWLAGFMQRLALAADLEKALLVARRTLALHRFARPFLAEYEARKQARGWLDFDDLIDKAGALLADPARAAWVLYRLDGGIDHILVDEAQDTSPAQWRVISLLAQEFTSGEGARDVARTVFVVGDPKQSIYSFQGADPGEFARMKAHFRTGLTQAKQPFQDLRLEYSFRSSPAVLSLVDAALDGREGLEDAGFRHIAFFDKPGRVDLWPLVPRAAYEETRPWHDTSDVAMPETHTSILARAVAEEIERMLAEETLPGEGDGGGGGPRPVEPGDILILVRGRKSGLFEALIRACKQAGLPVAGADRLKLGAELAVKDLTALLRFLATPEDDLSLAALLRSPLSGLSEAALYALAQPRPEGSYLWSALRQSDHGEVVEMLDDLRRHADFLRPYELLERVLTRHRGRANLLARLGREAEDGIDALLAQALGYESAETPSLTGFLQWLDAKEVEIKRQMDSAGNLIRVMSVHGAKGLEAPIVFLPDCAKRDLKLRDALLATEGGPVWKPNRDQMPEALAPAIEAARQAARDEDTRLLYVAATRAANWLIVAAAGEPDRDGACWHDVLAEGLRAAGGVTHTFALGEGLRLESGQWPTCDRAGRMDCEETAAPPLPDWATRPPAPFEPAPAPLSPSDLGGAKALPGEGAGLGEEAARARGRHLHKLLEVLPDHPRADWPEIARALLADAEDTEALLAEAAALITDPALAHVFAPGTLAEVDLSARLPAPGPEGRPLPLHGSIDRLIVGPDTVTVIDFKSNALVPQTPEEVPEGILRQMGAYMEAIAQIFPERAVECAILWTTKAQLMPIPPALARAALNAAPPLLDDAGPAT